MKGLVYKGSGGKELEERPKPAISDPADAIGRISKTTVRFRLRPDVTIAIGACVKRPRAQLIGDPTELKLVDRSYGDEMGSLGTPLGWRHG